MRDDELDQVIQRAKSGRSSLEPSPDIQRTWQRIGSARARHAARRSTVRAAMMFAVGAIVVAAGVAAVIRLVPGIRKEPASYAGGPAMRGAATGRSINLLPAHQEPKFELRTVVSAEQLANVDASDILADEVGNVYVADRLSKQVVVFDSGGNRLATMGPNGSAAGGARQTFTSIGAIAWLADTIVVADNSAAGGELYFLSRGGQLLGRRNVKAGIGSIDALYSAGDRLFGVTILGDAAGTRRTYFRVGSSNQRDVTLALRDTMMLPSSLVCTDAARAAKHTVKAPFASLGQLRAFTIGGDLVVAARDTLELRVYDSRSGKSAGQISAEFRKAILTEERWQAETRDVQALRAQIGQVECVPAITRPVTEPVALSIVADERGRFWVEANGAGGTQLMVIDVAQATIESTSMPSRDYIIAPAVRGSKMLFVSRDARGRPMISAYSKRY